MARSGTFDGRKFSFSACGPWLLLIAVMVVATANEGWGQSVPFPGIQIGVGRAEGPEEIATTLQIVALLTVLALAPSLLIMLTSFTRIVVVLSFLRQAMGTQQMPPNQVLIGLALFLTLFTMSPVWDRVNERALRPFLAEEISQEQALENAVQPLREFMLRQTREKDLALLVSMGGKERPRNQSDVSLSLLIPAFAMSELKTAFQIGFLIYIPFLILDMVVACVLLSMGMLMLPPIMISLPFKLLLFVLVDGWYLVVGSLVKSFA